MTEREAWQPNVPREGLMFIDKESGQVFEMIFIRERHHRHGSLIDLKLHGPEFEMHVCEEVQFYENVLHERWRVLTSKEAAAVE